MADVFFIVCVVICIVSITYSLKVLSETKNLEDKIPGKKKTKRDFSSYQ